MLLHSRLIEADVWMEMTTSRLSKKLGPSEPNFSLSGGDRNVAGQTEIADFKAEVGASQYPPLAG
jgi:hypothetical protein